MGDVIQFPATGNVTIEEVIEGELLIKIFEANDIPLNLVDQFRAEFRPHLDACQLPTIQFPLDLPASLSGTDRAKLMDSVKLAVEDIEKALFNFRQQQLSTLMASEFALFLHRVGWHSSGT